MMAFESSTRDYCSDRAEDALLYLPRIHILNFVCTSMPAGRRLGSFDKLFGIVGGQLAASIVSEVTGRSYPSERHTLGIDGRTSEGYLLICHSKPNPPRSDWLMATTIHSAGPHTRPSRSCVSAHVSLGWADIDDQQTNLQFSLGGMVDGSSAYPELVRVL